MRGKEEEEERVEGRVEGVRAEEEEGWEKRRAERGVEEGGGRGLEGPSPSRR